MKNLIYLALFLAVYFLIGKLNSNLIVHEQSTLLVGIMLLASYLFARMLKKIRLPRLTGYMLMGVLLGSTGIGYLTSDVMNNLQFLENLALSFIALTAGGELKFSKLRAYKKTITLILGGQIVIIFLGMIVLFMIISRFIPFLENQPLTVLFGLAVLFAGTALSTSPATTIGIITEMLARGKVTNIILSVTVLKAIFLILFFPLVITSAKFLIIAESQLNLQVFIDLFLQLMSSVAGGVLTGILIIWYFKKIKAEISIFLLAVALVIAEISSLFGLEILLTSLVAGIVVQNFSRQGDTLISGIEIFSLPIYVIFFCFAGASLHLETLSKALFLTFFLVAARFVLNYAGNYLGAALAREEAVVKNVSWMGYIGQAGIALGLGIIIEQNLAGELGAYFMTILVSTVVINEMIGPVLLRYVFIKADEAEIRD